MNMIFRNCRWQQGDRSPGAGRRRYGSSTVGYCYATCDGFAVLKYMKENQLQDVPVVLISANVNDENIHKAYSYEVADYIQKPFQEPVVKRRVESIIELFEKKKQMKAKGSP